MTLVAVALVGGEGLGALPVAALVLPLVEAAVHRDRVCVAELLERLHRKGRAHPARTHHDHLRVPVGHAVLDVGLELPAGYVDRSGDRALLVLVGLADVEEDVAIGQELLAPGGVDLGDRLLCLLEEFTETGHGRNPT